MTNKRKVPTKGKAKQQHITEHALSLLKKPMETICKQIDRAPGKLVMVGVNKKRFWPTVQAIKERYYLKYRGGAGPSAEGANEE